MRILGLALVLSALTAGAGEETPKFRAYDHPVMSWVPAYGTGKAMARLKESYDGVGMKDGLTHLGLQFWAPTKEGGVRRVGKEGALTDAAIGEFRDWGHTNGVRVLLCIFNATGKWDWELARSGFVDHPKEFADALMAEVEKLNLDGIDLDLEGPGNFEKDKTAFVEFTRDLSTRLHAKGKHLTIDTFSYKWNAPNQTWWAELLPLADGLTTMGYESIGSTGDDWRGYKQQKSAAGEHAAKLMIGMPTGKEEWKGNKALEQLEWIIKDGGVGVSFWDAQLPGAAWRTKAVWEAVGKIRKKAQERVVE